VSISPKSILPLEPFFIPYPLFLGTYQVGMSQFHMVIAGYICYHEHVILKGYLSYGTTDLCVTYLPKISRSPAYVHLMKRPSFAEWCNTVVPFLDH
jgi:hypothetical protein